MSKEQSKKREYIRKIGKINFALICSLCGVILFIFLGWLGIYFNILDKESNLMFFIRCLSLFIGNFFVAIYIWHQSEKNYLKNKER